jgi:hypothetical protein
MIQQGKQVRHTPADPYKEEKAICSSSYDGSFLVSFCVCALQSYDAFSFYHKAFVKRFFKLLKELF